MTRPVTPAAAKHLVECDAADCWTCGKVTREAGPMKGGTRVIAFVEDPDGYKIELIQRD